MAVLAGAMPYSTNKERNQKIKSLKKEFDFMVTIKVDKEEKLILYYVYSTYKKNMDKV